MAGVITTYSFADVSFVMSHPAVGSFTFTGEGVGSISFNMANDATTHDAAADGSIMISKILAENGAFVLNLHQTSEGHKWLKKWNAYIKSAPTNQWAQANGILKNPALGEQINFTAISPQKRADGNFQAHGQLVAWNLMAARITG